MDRSELLKSIHEITQRLQDSGQLQRFIEEQFHQLADQERILLCHEITKLLKPQNYTEWSEQFNASGHEVDIERFMEVDLSQRLIFSLFANDQLQRLKEAIIANQPLAIPFLLPGDGLVKCYYCAQEIDMLFDGQNIKLAKACPYPNGIPLVFELSIPSGIMVVANDLRPAFDEDGEENRPNINYEIGCVERTLAMAAIGCAYAYVGNSCPSVYRLNEGELIIASGYDCEGEKVAHIITDLWWYSIVDGDEFERRGCSEQDYGPLKKVSVKPGVYQFTHLIHLKNFDRSKNPRIFTRIKWLRPPDPVIN